MGKYPFKFLDAYNRDDRVIFFGRDEEIAELYEMVFQSSVILIYGGSGTGKSSLINCGLAGKFQPHDWLPLMIRRGSNLNESLEKELNNAGGNLTTIPDETNWHDEWSDESETSAVVLSPVARAIKAVYNKSFKPIFLVFDQFEELFIIGSQAEQELFTKNVQDILKSDQPVKLIFSIREEYLGHLFDFERAVPQLLRKKLRIEPMNLEKVKQVIIGAAEFEGSIISIKPGEADQVAEGIFNKIKGKGKSLTIQLPFLQVFLDKFYLKITGDQSRQAEAEFNVKTLHEMGEIGDILIDFLEEQVTAITKKISGKYPALNTETTWKILSPLSTLEGTKEPISKKALYERLPGLDKNMVDDVVDEFINSRILRYNEATDTFEIAHDSLAMPISKKRSAEETVLLEIKRLIKSQVSVKEEARELFTEKQLLFIEPFLEKFKTSDEERNWIDKSRVFIQAQKDAGKKKRRKRLVLAGIIILMVISLISVYALQKAQEAKRLRNIEFAQKLLIASNRAENDLNFPAAAFISRIAYLFYKENQGNDFRNYYTHLFHKLELLDETVDRTPEGYLPSLDSNMVFSIANANSTGTKALEFLKGYVYSGYSDGKILKTKLADSMVQSQPFYDFEDGLGMHMSTSKDNNFLAVCGFFPFIQVFDVRKQANESVKLKFPLVSDYSKNVLFTDNGSLLMLTDSALAGWDSKFNVLKWRERKEFDYVGGKFISFSANPGYPKIHWNANSVSIPGVKFNCMSVHMDLIAVGFDSGLFLINKDSLIKIKLANIGIPNSIQFDSRGNYLYIGCDNGRLAKLKLSDFSIETNRNHTRQILTIVCSKDDGFIATASVDGSVMIYEPKKEADWKYSTPLILKLPKPCGDELEPSPITLAFSDEQQIILAGYNNGAIYKWPVSADRLSDLIHDGINKTGLNSDSLLGEYIDKKASPVNLSEYIHKKDKKYK